MNIDAFIEKCLTEAASQIDKEKYQLYIDLNDKLLKSILRKDDVGGEPAKENIKTVNYILGKYHTGYYQDLSSRDVQKIKMKFKQDFLSKKNIQKALSGVDSFETK